MGALCLWPKCLFGLFCHTLICITTMVYKFSFYLFSEGEQEAEWLIAAGLAQLAAPFQAGREITELDVAAALRRLPRAQADAARKRVRHLNRTLRRQRARRPDIRDVFRDLEVSPP